MSLIKRLAWLGFFCSVVVHLFSLGHLAPWGSAAFVLHLGVFVVFFPAVWLCHFMPFTTGNGPQSLDVTLGFFSRGWMFFYLAAAAMLGGPRVRA